MYIDLVERDGDAIGVQCVVNQSSEDRGIGNTSVMERLSVIGVVATVKESWLAMDSS